MVSSVINIYEKRHKILDKLKNTKKYSIDTRKYDLAKSINSGGYVLLFRHAEREKWIDVQMYEEPLRNFGNRLPHEVPNGKDGKKISRNRTRHNTFWNIR